MKHHIAAIHGHEILDSRGNPTLSVTVMLKDGTVASASVPSGASTGVHEALELRDGDKKRYGGKGVQKAVANIRKIERRLIGHSVFLQEELDNEMILMDGTPNKSKLGANAILGVSLACAHAGARSKRMPLYEYIRAAYGLEVDGYTLPYPMMNVMNGGAHAGWLLDIQEFMVVPKMRLFHERVRAGSEIFHALGKRLKKHGHSTLVGDEGGYSSAFPSNLDALKFLSLAVKDAGYKLGKDVFFAMDVAASEFYQKGRKQYVLKKDKKRWSRKKMVEWYEKMLEMYPIMSIEDPLDQDDWDGWAELTERLSSTMIVGDDLFVTNTERLRKGINEGVANSILIKLNQIGTLSETIEAILLAQAYDYDVIVSHRSGETTDTTIADLAVAVGAGFIKTGSLSRGERVAKYNRLMEIEEEVRAR